MRITITKYLYLILATAGLAVPIYFVGPVLLQPVCLFDSGCALQPDAVEAGWHAMIAESLVIYFAWIVWMFGEVRKRGIRRWWAYPLLTLVSPFSFVFCLFLFVQARGRESTAG